MNSSNHRAAVQRNGAII